MTTEYMLNELVSALKNQKRPEKIEIPVYGKYTYTTQTFVYSDADKKYVAHTSKKTNKEVRSAKAFSLSIKEELKRRENMTGNKATVKINLRGGEFIPDDDFEDYEINYNRLNSQQWNLIKNTINKTLNHVNFLTFLKMLKPSFVNMGLNFSDFFSRYATLRLIGNSELTSNPIITKDGQIQGYKCTYKLDNGCDGEEVFPENFEVEVPFAKAGEKKYTIPIDLLFTRDDDNQLEITIQCPEFENIEEKAILDESDYIKEETKDFSELLILADF